MRENELYWLAGILEGEGSFCVLKTKHSPFITFGSTDEDVTRHVSDLFDSPYHIKKPGKEGWKEQYHCRLWGKRAVDLMRELRPLMGARRRSQIDKAIASSYVQHVCKWCESSFSYPATIGRRRYFCTDFCRRQSANKRSREWRRARRSRI